MGRGEGGERRSGWAALPGVENWTWNYYVKLLEANNIGLPNEHAARLVAKVDVMLSIAKRPWL